MKILRTQTLRGPNYWSIRRDKLIVMRLDLEDLAEKPSNEIQGFYEGLIDVLPSLVEHYCSPGYRGGFLNESALALIWAILSNISPGIAGIGGNSRRVWSH